MSVTSDTLSRLEQHWAVSAIDAASRNRAREIAKIRLVHASVGKQMSVEFNERHTDDDLLERVATAYELAAAEGLETTLHSVDASDGILREQAQAGAYMAYELRRILTVPSSPLERVFHVLHLSTLAYCGDRWAENRRWLKDRPEECSPPSVAEVDWDRRILFRLFDCWVRLFRKNRWDDLDGIREVVAGLREDQKAFESTFLESEADSAAQALAFRLVALYNWAKATELLAVYMLQGTPVSILTNLDKHFEDCRHAAECSRDSALEMLIRWLHASSHKMVHTSIWWVTQPVNSRITKFVRKVTKSRSLFELLPPQDRPRPFIYMSQTRPERNPAMSDQGQPTKEGRKAEANERFLKIRANIEASIATINEAKRLADEGLNLGMPGEHFDHVAETMGAERLRHVCKSLEKVEEELRESHDAICKGKRELNGGQSDDPIDQAAPVAVGTGGVAMSHGGQAKNVKPAKSHTEQTIDKILETAHGAPGQNTVDAFFQTLGK